MGDLVQPELVLTGDLRDQFRFLWSMNVKGFNPDKHCQACFKGKKFDLSDGEVIKLAGVEVGDFVYVCGVAKTWEYNENLHLVGIYTGDGESCRVEGFAGGTATLVGFRRYRFSDKAARELFPERDETYLTCRNFQFAAQVFGRPD